MRCGSIVWRSIDRFSIGSWLRRLLIAATLGSIAMAAPGQPRTYTNPVLDQDFPDPSTLQVGTTLYAYGTGADTKSGSTTPYIRMTKSTDLIHWSPAVTVMPLPRWAVGATWAPHVIRDSGIANRYVMYFSAKADVAKTGLPADTDKCLGVATATSPEGPFTPLPDPLRCGPKYFNIDPMAFRDPSTGTMTLYWGSNRRPIVKQPLAKDLLGFAPGSQPTEVIAPVPANPYAKLAEGSWVLDRGGYRYIFLSGSDCCGAPDGYAVWVARRKLSGGDWERYTGGQHGAILRRNDAWDAPGHNGIFKDGAGQYWMIYHARHAGTKGARQLLIDRIEWIDGWPRIAGDSPSSGPVAAPVPLRR